MQEDEAGRIHTCYAPRGRLVVARPGSLLTSEQLGAMDASEGRPQVYEFVKVQNVEFSTEARTVAPLYSYVDVLGGVMTCRGKPVNLHATNQMRARSLLASASGEDQQRGSTTKSSQAKILRSHIRNSTRCADRCDAFHLPGIAMRWRVTCPFARLCHSSGHGRDKFRCD